MGDTTSRRCLSRLTMGMDCCHDLANIYLRKPAKSDERNIIDLHLKVHNIPGMMGSLDVSKAHWKNCPTTWKGQYQGREKFAGLGLEAVVDHNLWFWHASFSFPWTLNDINIWKWSSLFESMINGDHDKIDFDFLVDGQIFSKLFYIVDGINRSLTRFLSSESDPHTQIAFSFATDREAHRKDIG